MIDMKYKTKRDIIINLLYIIIGIILGWFIHSYLYESSEVSTNSMEIVVKNQLINNQVINSDIYNNVYSIQSKFKQTIRNCLGYNCFDEKVNNIDRIGILAPLRSGGKAVEKLLTISSTNKDINLLYDTHVPAYGYGKNHGWSRIIRIVRDVVPHSHSLITNYNSSLKNFDLQIRQLIRWHCRLSHVAAHTKMLSISINDLINQPLVEIEKMLTFIGDKVFRIDIQPLINNFLIELSKDLGFNHLNVSCDYNYLKNLDSNFHLIASSTIEQELNSTNNLFDWPCLTFQSLEKDSNLLMSSNMLSANCSDPYVKCSVRYDKVGG